MKRSFDDSEANFLYVEAPTDVCPSCGGSLWICEHKKRFVSRLDGLYCLVQQNRWCVSDDCEMRHRILRAPRDLRFAPPFSNYGMDVVLDVGERHLRDAVSLRRIGRDLNERGVPLSQRSTCRLLRSFVALTQLARGDDEMLRKRLVAQGGIVLMADGVQFDAASPVLYLVWDAVSGEPIFGERKAFRGADDLVPLLERVKAMDIPVIGAVSDKEKGLLPAVAQVFPGLPHQLCQLHFLKNCALGMESDLHELGRGVADRAERVRKIAKRLHNAGWDSVEQDGFPAEPPTPPLDGAAALPSTAKSDDDIATPQRANEAIRGSLSEEQLAAELCAMVRHGARASGRAPLNPPEEVRHQRIEAVRATVEEALKKRANTKSSNRSHSP